MATSSEKEAERMESPSELKATNKLGTTRPKARACSLHSMDSVTSHRPIVKILVIYTGGTIGMVPRDGVYAPVKNRFRQKLATLPVLHDQEYADIFLSEEEKEKYLVLPLTKEPNRIYYEVLEFDPLLDSSNITPAEWAKIGTVIEEQYSNYGAFIILHGTDTMAYTASALSFMFENLGKPVILTGAQIPIFEVRSDGRSNFASALIIAGNFHLPEVMVCFDDKIYRGNRCTKVDTSRFHAFDSPNMSPLASLEIKINVQYNAVFHSGKLEAFRVQKEVCPNVGLLRLFPGITSQTVRAFMQPPIQGVVLQTYGAGNAPDNRPDLLSIFKEASNWGVMIINITQCNCGHVATTYATGQALENSGVIPGGDMTVEAALTKLSYVLSKPDWHLEKKRKMMQRNLRGEVTIMMQEEISPLDVELIESVAKTLSLSSEQEIMKVRDALYPNLMNAAAMTGDIPSMEKIRQLGGNISAGNHDGRTPLHVSAQQGHYAAVQYLLSHGASVHARDCRGDTAMVDAILGKFRDIIVLLKQTGAKFTTKDNTAVELAKAVAEEDEELVRCWLLAGVDPNVQDFNLSALRVAIHSQNTGIVECLLEHGAKVDVPDIFGNTPMAYAEKLGYTEILDLLKAKTE